MFLQRTKVLIGSLVIATAALLSVGMPVCAASDIEIQLSPGDQKLELKPGEVTSSKFKITNNGRKPFKYELSASPLTVGEKNYEYGYTKETNYTQISKWISFPQPSGMIEPGKTVEALYTVRVPMDAPNGGQYAVIFASTKDGSEGSSVVTTKSVGMKVYARVPGRTIESGTIISNNIDSFLFKPPLFASATVRSDSNVDITAHYDLEVTNFFTGRRAFVTEPGAYDKILLPNTEYISRVQWEDAPQLGVFRVRHTVRLLDKVLPVEKIVVILPLWFIFLILLAVFLAIFWIISRSKARRAAKQASNY